MYDLSIPQRIADRRKRRKLAGYQLAKKAGISPSYLSLIERGHKLPSVEVAVRIARALGDREELYRAWVETADVEDEQDLDRRIDRLTTLRRTRSLPAFPHQPPSPSMRTEEAPGMSDWQAQRITEGFADSLAPILSQTTLSTLSIPLIPIGDDPETISQTGETITLDASLLDKGQTADQLFAYRATRESIRQVDDLISAGDLIVLAKDPEGVDPELVYALRLRGRIVLTRLVYTDRTLLLMGTNRSPVPVAISDESTLLRMLAGVVVSTVRSWPMPKRSLSATARPSLGRLGKEEDGNIIRDCDWKPDYGWRPLQKATDMDYLIENPSQTIQYRLLRDGQLRYILEMDASQWQAALGDYFDGPTWRRNGYIVAITKKLDGEYSETFQERWEPHVRVSEEES